jgi:hypothetical protein
VNCCATTTTAAVSNKKQQNNELINRRPICGCIASQVHGRDMNVHHVAILVSDESFHGEPLRESTKTAAIKVENYRSHFRCGRRWQLAVDSGPERVRQSFKTGKSTVADKAGDKH